MSATVIQFIPRPNPNRDQAVFHTLEQMAAEIINVALIDHLDTAPCEYSAPEQDPA